MGLILPMAGIVPILIESEVPAGTPRPDNVTGAYVTLVGRGGDGSPGTAVTNKNQVCYGGDGGGGGAVITRTYVPVSLLGPTYRLTSDASSRACIFSSGGVTLTAGWGANGANGAGGGSASASGMSGVVGFGGGGGAYGGTGMNPGNSSAAVTSGGASGGGGGGGSYSTTGGGRPGGSPGAATGPLGKDGYRGAGGTASSSSARGGSGGGGGGFLAATSVLGGAGLIRVEWV